MRIAIVNDTPMMLESLKRIIDTDPKHEIAWLAEDGLIATEKCDIDVPDLILMDLIMPVMNGVEACKIIMQESPCSILVVTSSVEENASLVFSAMGYGALDAVNTPVLNPEHPDYSAENLLNKINIIEKLISPRKPPSLPSVKNGTKNSNAKPGTSLLVIGASTGGPAALVVLLKKLPADFPVPIVIIQHIDQQFCPGFVEWVDEQVLLSTSMAKQGVKPLKGHIYISAGNKHLTIDSNECLSYSDEPIDYPYQPSVNVFFNSVAENWQGGAYGVLLTGMGKDGAEGLLALKKQGFPTIAQNEESCAVYGMPKEAAKLDAAKYILALRDISRKLIDDIH